MSQVGMPPQRAVEGRYLLDAALDRWGVGEAWQCRDKNFRNRPVVLEFFAPDRADAALEHSQDIRTQRALKHPCVLPVINQGTHEGQPWVAFDGFEGVSLARFIDDERRARAQVDRATAEQLFDKVLDGVSAAHEASTAVLHGCLSPRSVLVKQGALKVVDFALAPLASPEVLGPFRAPELARAGEPVSIASDVYALGALLVDLLMPQNVGDPRRALEGFLAALTRDGAQAGRTQRHDVPPVAWDVIARCLRRDPSTRWEDVSTLRKALLAAWATAPAPAPAAPVAAPVVAPPHRPHTLAMPPASSPLRAPTAIAPPAPFAAPAFSSPPQAPFAPAPFTAPPFVAPQSPVSPSAWDVPPPPPSSAASEAWSTLKPAGHAHAREALASSWDAPASPPIVAPASLASAWDAGDVNPDWAAPPSYAPPLPAPHAPLAGVHRATVDDDWEDETRASMEHPSRTSMPSAIAPMTASKALQNRLSEMERQESTMALDIDSLNAAAGLGLATPVAPAPVGDDWKEGVVYVDTSSAAHEEDDDEVYEPGSRTQVAAAPAPVLDTMETLRPMQRPVALDPFIPRPLGKSGPVDAESTFVANSPLVPDAPARPVTLAPSMPHAMPVAMSPIAMSPNELPPVSERTMALDIPGGPAEANYTMPAPMGLMGAPRPYIPPAPLPVVAPTPKASKLPIVVAVVIALVLIVGALAVVATRR